MTVSENSSLTNGDLSDSDIGNYAVNSQTGNVDRIADNSSEEIGASKDSGVKLIWTGGRNQLQLKVDHDANKYFLSKSNYLSCTYLRNLKCSTLMFRTQEEFVSQIL